MSIYEQIKALNKQGKRQMADFVRKSLSRIQVEARNQTERKSDERISGV